MLILGQKIFSRVCGVLPRILTSVAEFSTEHNCRLSQIICDDTLDNDVVETLNRNVEKSKEGFLSSVESPFISYRVQYSTVESERM